VAAEWLRFRAELRTRWRSALALALLVRLAGGIVLTTVAGARRTDWQASTIAVVAVPAWIAGRTRLAAVLRSV
jgi:hypothetical protein